MWRKSLSPDDLGGNSVLGIAVDPVRTGSPVWLIDVEGGVWVLENGLLQEGDAPSPLKAVAALNDRDLLAIDRDNRLWARTMAVWEERASPGAPADPPESVTGDGLGRGCLATRGGRVFVTGDFGASFQEDRSFGPGSPQSAKKACRTDRPSATRFYLDTQGNVWRRAEIEPARSFLDIGGFVLDLSVAEDGMLWIIKEFLGIRKVFTTDGLGSAKASDGSEEAFTVAAAAGGSAWAAKSDGTLWEFVPESSPIPASGEGDESLSFSGDGKLVVIPPVAGLSLQEAEMRIGAVGLIPGFTLHEHSDAITEGFVIRSQPDAGETVPSRSGVDLVLSLGHAPTGFVPNVIGLDRAGAAAVLARDGYSTSFEERPAASVPIGTVFGTAPPPETSHPTGSNVIAFVATDFAIEPVEPPPPDEILPPS